MKATKRKPAAPEPEVRACHFCRRDQRLALVRLIVGEESRLVWACPDHR